jgi:gluconokinase
MNTPSPSPFPRSAYDQVGGIVYFARMLDKIRRHAAGKLPPDYHANLGRGFDGRCIRFLQVDYAALRERVLQGGNDDEILAWCFGKGRRPSEEDILVWNSFMRKRGWHDEADGTTAELDNYKAQSGLAHRADLMTFFDYYEVDEGRKS